MKMAVGETVDFHGNPLIPHKVWDIDNHCVAWVQVGGETGATHLMCECDLLKRDKPYTYGGTDDPNMCPAKKTVEQERLAKTTNFYSLMLQTHPLEEVIEEIFHRVHEKKEFLGQQTNMIYAQQVATMTGKPLREVLAALEMLYAKDRIELNGMILQPFRQRFRFPKEIQSLLRFMIEEPLGWPNGDAGDCFLERLEGAITRGSDYKHGRDAFGHSNNWPRLAPHVKVIFGSQWLAESLMYYMTRAAQGDEQAQGKIDEIAAFLETWLNMLREGKPYSGEIPKNPTQ